MGKIKDVCIYGLGGIGSAIGGLSCTLEHIHKARVSFIARGRHLDAINREGLHLELPDKKEFISRPHHASTTIKDVPRPQLIFIAVKSYDLQAVLADISGILESDTMIIPLMNGFDIYDRIRKTITKGVVFPSCVVFGGRKTGEGTGILYIPGSVFLGPDPRKKEFDSAPLHSFIKAFEDSPARFNWVPDPYPIIWQKYIANVAINLVGAYSGKAVGEIIADAPLKQRLVKILEEAAHVVSQKGVPLSQDVVELILSAIAKIPFDTRSSYAVDIESRSPKNEGDLFGTAIIELAGQVRVPAPVIEETFTQIQVKMKTNI